MGFQVIGAHQVVAAFGAAAILGEAAALAEVEQVKRDIKLLAQIYVPKDTYELHDSIAIVDDGVEAGAPHAGPVEYGSPTHPAPQPYLRPAVDEVTNELKGSQAMAVMARMGR